MEKIFFNIISILLISLWPAYISDNATNNETLCLPEIDLSNHHRLSMLITRTVREAKGLSNNKVNYLTVDLMNDTSGIRMEIVAHERKNLFWYDRYEGYAIIEGKPVIFENQSNIRLREMLNHKAIFTMDNRDTPPVCYDPDEWHFILKENEYARYYEGSGWKWFQYEN